MGYGVITLLPAILVLATAIYSKRVTEALMVGCATSYLIIAYFEHTNPVTLIVDSFFSIVTDYDTMWLVIVCALFGSLIAVMNAAKGTIAIAKFLGRFCKTEKSLLFISWLLGVIIFVDDYMNIMTISACTKNLSDERKVPREALAYVIDSTGAPVCILIPFSTWAIFFAGVFYEYDEVINLGYGSAMETYYHVIPFMFYAIAAVFIVPLFALGIIPKLGAMKKAYERVETTGKVYSDASAKFNKTSAKADAIDNGKKPSLIDFVIPIATMIILQLVTDDMFIGIVAAILVAAVLYVPTKKVKGGDFCDLWMGGFADSIAAVAIIVMALWMKTASSDLGLPEYVIHFVEPLVTPTVYPLIAFLVVSLLGFITGSNWGTPAVCAPIIIPLGAACGANLLIVCAAIACGGVFCSHACFYSDATVITSTNCGIENMDHVYTQLPYAAIAFILACIAFLVSGFIF